MNENTCFTYENHIGRIDFSIDSCFWVTDIEGASGIQTDITQSRGAGQIGSSVAGQCVQPRILLIDGAIFDPIEHNRERLLTVFAPQIPATFTVTKNGESWYLDVLVQKTPELTPGNGVQSFQTTLYAAYPYWRSVESVGQQIAGLTPLFHFPFFTGGTWYISRFSDSYFSTMENNGNVPIEFKVTFTARSALAKPELYHVGTQKRIRLNKTMSAGEKMTVCTMYGKKEVACISASGVQSNGFPFLSIDSDLSMALMPGSNLLRVGAASNREGLSVRVEAPRGVVSGV